MIELLAPAGSMEALRAAVQNGADAVYLGCGSFNARQSAKNFTIQTLSEAVKYCHVRGVQVHLTLNTLVSDREMNDCCELIRQAAGAGVDAFIVQDLGVVQLCRQIAPKVPIHGSTQMTVHSLAGVQLCAAWGLKRVVLSRELNREEIQYICANSPIEIEVFAGGANALAIISGGHTRFVHVARCGEVLFSLEGDTTAESNASAEPKDPELTLRRVWDFATTAPIDELRFILEAKRLNMNAAHSSLKGDYGHAIGKLFRAESERNIMGDTLHCQIVGMTTAACDARMAGAMIPVMSNSGSGNQGLTSTVPVVVYGEQTGASEEQMIRALILSHLTVIYIKQSLGRLSALCGCVVAATGSCCGITYLMNGSYDECAAAVKNMIANLTGMICDGAKPSCALKCASGVSMAVLSALMAKNGRCVKSVEGIIDNDVDKSIRNLTDIGRDAMTHTDAMILRIMTSKC